MQCDGCFLWSHGECVGVTGLHFATSHQPKRLLLDYLLLRCAVALHCVWRSETTVPDQWYCSVCVVEGKASAAFSMCSDGGSSLAPLNLTVLCVM